MQNFHKSTCCSILYILERLYRKKQFLQKKKRKSQVCKKKEIGDSFLPGLLNRSLGTLSKQIVSEFCIHLTCNSSKYLYLPPSLGT